MNRNHFWLTAEQFARLEPLLPTDTRGKPRVDDRRVISGIIHVLKTGGRWVDAPEVYGPHKTLYNRFVRWAAKGVWIGVFDPLASAGGKATRASQPTHSRASMRLFFISEDPASGPSREALLVPLSAFEQTSVGALARAEMCHERSSMDQTVRACRHRCRGGPRLPLSLLASALIGRCRSEGKGRTVEVQILRRHEAEGRAAGTGGIPHHPGPALADSSAVRRHQRFAPAA